MYPCVCRGCVYKSCTSKWENTITIEYASRVNIYRRSGYQVGTLCQGSDPVWSMD